MTVQLVIEDGLYSRLTARAASAGLTLDELLEAVASEDSAARVDKETLAVIDRQIGTYRRLFARLAE